MSHNDALEARVSQLLALYANDADVDVDPLAVARSSMAGTWEPVRHWGIPARRHGLGFVAVVIAALTAIGGASLMAGAWSSAKKPDSGPAVRVEPYRGLPPLGATPSTPERGELVLSLSGRMSRYGVLSTWVYADGRRISVRQGGTVIEQRLRPEGVELLRSTLSRTASPAPSFDPLFEFPETGPGVVWGGASVRLNDQLTTVTWTDPSVVERLVDPESWLAPLAWEDPRSYGYVPSRYAACLSNAADPFDNRDDPGNASERLMGRLPASVRDILLDEGTPTTFRGPIGDAKPDCFELPLDAARRIDRVLRETDLERRESYVVTFWLPTLGAEAPMITKPSLSILPTTPHGDIICDCG